MPSAKVIKIIVIDPFCSPGEADVEVENPNTTSSADLSLTSSVNSNTVIAPSSGYTIPPSTTTTKTFSVTLSPSAMVTTVTFTAKAKQAGPPHVRTRTVNVGCEPPSEKDPRVIGIIVASPFCEGSVQVRVAKPDTVAAAVVTLTSSVGDTDIAPASYAVAAERTAATAMFDVSLPAQTKAQSVTFTATVTQEGYPAHRQQTKVEVECEPANDAGPGCDPDPPRPQGYC